MSIVCWCWLSNACGESVKEMQAQLMAVRENIQQIRTTLLKHDKIQHNSLKSVQNIDDTLSHTVVELTQTEQQIHTALHNIEQLTQYVTVNKQQLYKSKEILNKIFQHSYHNQLSDAVKLLAKPQSARHWSRNQVFNQYFFQQRRTQIGSLKKTLAHNQQLTTSLRTQNHQYNTLQKKLIKKKHLFSQLKQHHIRQLANMREKIMARSNDLTALQSVENSIVTLIEQLQVILVDVTEDLGQNQTFEQAKQTLIWPVTGTVQYHFRKTHGPMQQDGIIIKTEAATVQAVFRGHVVYADTLRGLGLLIILDHGDGYASLYGKNQRLYKSVGEWVEQGDEVASTNYLYFGLRLHGEAIDPQLWLRPKKNF